MKQPICIRYNDFVKEHNKLLNILEHPTKQSLHTKVEATVGRPSVYSEFIDQSKELKKVVGEGINFKKVKWGEFTKDLEKYNKTHSNTFENLHSFAIHIQNHPKGFSKLIKKRANFYLNVLIHL